MTNPPNPAEYPLKIKDVCRLVDPNNPISRWTLWRWIKDGKIPPPTMIGKSRRWSYANLGYDGPETTKC